MWRSFHFDENTETLDSYVTHIRHVATLLGYEEPQVLEVFKNTPAIRLYWVFPIEDLRTAVETAKRILKKEKIDRQFAGWTSLTPFMNIKDEYISKSDDSNPHEIIPISFNMYQVLHEKYYNAEIYLVQTRSKARSSGIKLPEVHGMGKNLDPN